MSHLAQIPAWLAALATSIALHLPAPRYRQAAAALALRALPLVTRLSNQPPRKETNPMNAQNLYQLLQTAAQVAPALVALEEAETNASLSPAEKKAAVLAAVASLEATVAPLLSLPANILAVMENQAALSFAYDLTTEGVTVFEDVTHQSTPAEGASA